MPALQVFIFSKYIRRALNGLLYALEASLVNLEQPNYLHVSVWMSLGNFVRLESFGWLFCII